MEINTEKYITERLQDQIDWYSQKSTTNKKYNYFLKTAILIISTSIPLISGISGLDDITVRIVLGILGAIVAILTGLVSLFKFQEKWTNYRTTSETLKHEKYLFLTKTSPYHEQDSFGALVNRVESIISRENSDWNSFFNKKDETKKG
ncbi:MAG: DUF4231 domain-containing protein [Bacteroidales bacterium]|jgi:hypothetical protein